MSSSGTVNAMQPTHGHGFEERLLAREMPVNVAVAHAQRRGRCPPRWFSPRHGGAAPLGGIENALGQRRLPAREHACIYQRTPPYAPEVSNMTKTRNCHLHFFRLGLVVFTYENHRIPTRAITNLGGSFTFPGTPIAVHRMGYGAMQLAGPRRLGTAARPGRGRGRAARGGGAGVNHIDTSDFYGPHVTNQIIKQALHPYPENLDDRHQGGRAPRGGQVVEPGAIAARV